MSEIKYRAAIYLRLSKEDGDKVESYSISNQRDLILDYAKNHPEIQVCDEMIDDGYSGSNFERPAFKKMLTAITNGSVNCVIVKDLSRFAREYVGSGYYLEKLFPTLGVRFIAINDNVDTETENNVNNTLILSFKNILNDSYIRDISVKIRSQFEIKRKKGEFIGAFPMFGYKKSDKDRHKLIIDENAAEIVKSIFHWRMDGMSAQAIANKLNLLNIPSPAEYKKLMGLNYSANLQQNRDAIWSAQAIIRILKNDIYTGVLAQGKSFTPNHKVKKVIEKTRDEWIVVDNAHEAIITKEMFLTVSELLKKDTRTAPKKEKNYLFSGFLLCADCKQNMVRKIAKTKKGEYAYYVCSTNKAALGCSCHGINETILYDKIIKSLQFYCNCVLEMKDNMSVADLSKITEAKRNEIEKAIEKNNKIISERKNDLAVTHRLRNDNLVDEEEFMDVKSRIMQEIKTAQSNIQKLQDELITVNQSSDENRKWMDAFVENSNIEKLTRKMLATLINKIYIHDNKQIVVEFRHYDKFEKCCKLLNNINENQIKEAI